MSRERLVALLQVALDHHADERVIASGAFGYHTVPDFLLARVLFAGVGVAAVHHEHRWQIRLSQRGCGLAQALGVGVWGEPATAQNGVSGRMTRRANDAGYAVLIDAQEAVRRARRTHGVNSNLQAAVGAVL